MGYPINLKSIVSSHPVIASGVIAVEYLSKKKAQLENTIGISYTPLKNEIEAIQLFVWSLELFASGILICSTSDSREEEKEGKSCIILSMQGLGISIFQFFTPALTGYGVYRCYTWIRS